MDVETPASHEGTSVFVEPAHAIQGEILLPGDKSISQRAVLFAMLGTEPVLIENLAPSGDVASCLRAAEQLGATVERDADDPTRVTITGNGRDLRVADGTTIDAGNSGTLARLLSGILAGQPTSVTITGDESLSGRPMKRITAPLSQMGARFDTQPGDTLPMTVHGKRPLQAFEYELPVASAQVQSAVLLAGLFADGPTTVIEPGALRDHTERMLRRAGVRVRRQQANVTIEPAERIELPDTTVPADPSAAAPFMVAASVLAGSLLRVPSLCMNPGRIGFLELLEEMGGRVATMQRRTLDAEPVADIEITTGALRTTKIRWENVPRIIDELPFVGLLAHFCRGETVVRGAAELRVKESDRIQTIVRALKNIGVNAEELKDGFVVRGSRSRPEGGTIDPEGDHRIAMLGGIAGVVSRHGVTVLDAECVTTSFPGFFAALDGISVR